MAELDDLDAELRALGQTLVVDAPADDLVEQVLARLPAAAGTVAYADRGWGRTRRRRLVAVIIALVILGLGLTPPVRAAVVEWLRIGGVLVRTAPPVTGPSPTPSPPPTIGPTVTLAAGQGAGGLPGRRAEPSSARPTGSRCRPTGGWWRWTGAPAPDQRHLDQFDGELSWMFLKRTRDPFQVTTVDGHDAIWFATAHSISYLRPRWPRTDRAGPDRRSLPGLGAGGRPGAG